MCFIFVNCVIDSSNISCNDLYQDFIIMYVWYLAVEIQYLCKLPYFGWKQITLLGVRNYKGNDDIQNKEELVYALPD